MDYEEYRRTYFADPPLEQRFAYDGFSGVALYFGDFGAAVDYYTAVLGPPEYVEGKYTRGWRLGSGWLTLLWRDGAAPSNVEVIVDMSTPEEAEKLQRAFIEAGGSGPEPSDQIMFYPVRFCPVQDPFGTEILIISPKQRTGASGEADDNASAQPEASLSATRQHYESGTPWEPRVGYSRAVRVGPFVHVSGTTATDESGHIVGGNDVYEQTAQALRNIDDALAAVGAERSDVVRTRVFVRGADMWEGVARAHQEAFGRIMPASTMVVCDLMTPEMLVEIEADAIVTDG